MYTSTPYGTWPNFPNEFCTSLAQSQAAYATIITVLNHKQPLPKKSIFSQVTRRAAHYGADFAGDRGADRLF